jgi:hypothetical protein
MINWLNVYSGKTSNMEQPAEVSELKNLKKEVKQLRKKFEKDDDECRVESSEEETDDKEEQDKVEAMIAQRQNAVKNKGQRSSVSAEVYGNFNVKKEWVPKIVPKSNETRQRISDKLMQSFLFQALDSKDVQTVLDAMEEVKCQSGDPVITEGENGEVLYLIEKGSYNCSKIFVRLCIALTTI